MKNTKEVIIAKALELFNKEGVQQTTLRKIAQSLGISQGNLNYYYKVKQEIIEKLYFDLVDKIDVEMRSLAMDKSFLSTLYTSSGITLKILYDYRFLLRDIHKILRENPRLKMHYLKLQEVRQEEYLQLFKGLISEGTIRKEEFNNEYKRLYARMNILGDNWINTQELLHEDVEDPITYYQSLFFEMIYPYLTKKGKQEYQSIFN